MQLVFHTGSHFTEEERLLKCVSLNNDAVRERGILIPDPAKYRKLISETMSAMRVSNATENARDVLLKAITDNATTNRLILSNADFFATAKVSVQNGLIYPQASERMGFISQIFHNDQLELFMAMRNPATFLPAIFQQSPLDGLIDFTTGIDLHKLRWSETLSRIRDAVPDVKMTVWCNEDAPLIWPQVLRHILGVENAWKITGGLDLLQDIIQPEGMNRLRAYLDKHPDISEDQLQQVMAVFLEKFAIEAAIEEELTMPGWTDALVSEMTAIYEEDVFVVESIPGVHFIAP